MSAALAIIDDWTERPRPAPSRARARPYLASRRHADGRVTTYDANGNRTQQVETNGPTPETTAYTYDTTDRLTQVAYPAKTTAYTYDAAYNRLTERTVNATAVTETDKTYAYNNRNQLTGITDNLNSANSVAYTFDVNGNQTGKTKSGVSTTFAYDVKDQLLTVRENTTTLGVFVYDYQGLRVVKDMGGSTVRYTYDDKSVLLQTDINGQTIAKYDYGTNRLLSLSHVTEGRQFYLFDALGSVSNLTTPAGAIQARYQYDAFGHQRAQAGSSWNRFTFTGHEQDKETNLYYFKARFYDPDTGRFLNQDPYLGDINTPPSLHRYLYAYANPTVYIDLDGYESLTTSLDEAALQAAKDDSKLKLAAIVTAQAGYKLADVITFGWIGKHDAARDRYDRGEISGEQYATEAGIAAVESGAYIAATVTTGGAGALVARTAQGARAATAIGRTVTAASAGGSAGIGYQATEDAIKGELSDAGTYLKSATIGATGGVVVRGGMALKETLGGTTVSEGLRVTQTKIKSMITREGAAGEVRQAGAQVTRSVEATASTLPASGFGADSVGAARVRGSVVEQARAVTNSQSPLYRYVGETEAQIIRNTGSIPNVDKAGNVKDVYLTDRFYETAGRAKTHLQLPNKPTYRVEVDPRNVPARSPTTKVNPTDNADSGPCRPPIPVHAGPPFRLMPVHDSGPCRASRV